MDDARLLVVRVPQPEGTSVIIRPSTEPEADIWRTATVTANGTIRLEELGPTGQKLQPGSSYVVVGNDREFEFCCPEPTTAWWA